MIEIEALTFTIFRTGWLRWKKWWITEGDHIIVGPFKSHADAERALGAAVAVAGYELIHCS